ncbi:16S rRNA (cytosine(1402)-N(4))-methyltransferase RsmH [Candidatus Parcubacteria bacterium]|nr:MAG: 16S rRNA (cytosine(1402)-N(4))-methyltransferase RsmH [Candidatus Parcubacteria bacterium]
MRTRRSQSSSSDPVLSTLSKDEGHRTVLLHEAVDSLELVPDDVVVDATLGGAGHAVHIAKKLDRHGTLVAFDLDGAAIKRAEAKLSTATPHVHLVQANFRDLKKETEKLGISAITKALFDLGWSSYQLDSGRGFSFLRDEPLLMTYTDAPHPATLTAGRIVNEWEEGNIADVLWGWGGERYSRRIARAIVEARKKRSIQTSQELAEIVSRAVPGAYRHGKIHPATRTFQALRIAVNDEFGALQEGLRAAWDMLAVGGRIAVISFHSTEDRIVKHLFANLEKEGGGKRVTKKPLIPSEKEIQENPRARSAKLRVIQKNSDSNFSHGNSHIQDQQV